MKKTLKMATLLVAAAVMLAACSKKEGTTAGGVHYSFEKMNPKAQQVQEGDVVVGELVVMFDTVKIFSNVGHPERVLQAVEGDPFYEGLMLLHVGDKATIAIEADTLAKLVERGQLPPTYTPGSGQKVSYILTVEDIVTKEELDAERENYMAEMQQRQQNEPAEIEAYVKANNITVKPTESGLYIVVKKKGKGPKATAGKTVAVNYTGTLLDGTMFDSSVESDAIRGGINTPGRPYEPFTYKMGERNIIRGWMEGLEGQTEGTIMQLIIPSDLAYGPMGTQDGRIQPFTPLVFDMEIVSVK
jgi:FKBP-type peptidyl-prolyl cis-trans isomerase